MAIAGTDYNLENAGKVINMNDPTNAKDGVNKQYLEANASPLKGRFSFELDRSRGIPLPSEIVTGFNQGKYHIAVWDENNACVAVVGTGIYQTSNGGTTWTKRHTDSLGSPSNDGLIRMSGDVVCWVRGGYGPGADSRVHVYRSTNKGVSWSQVFYEATYASYVNQSYTVSPNRQSAAMFGYAGSQIMRTKDNGATWERLGYGAGSGFSQYGTIESGVIRNNGDILLCEGSAVRRILNNSTSLATVLNAIGYSNQGALNHANDSEVVVAGAFTPDFGTTFYRAYCPTDNPLTMWLGYFDSGDGQIISGPYAYETTFEGIGPAITSQGEGIASQSPPFQSSGASPNRSAGGTPIDITTDSSGTPWVFMPNHLKIYPLLAE